MNRRALLAALPATAVATAATAPSAMAQTWPAQPVRAIVPFAAGSATDILGRLFAERMRDNLGQPVVVENRAGASGMIGAEAVARSAPDGYTVLFGTNSTQAAANALFRRVPYDQERDFAPVSTLASIPLLVAVAANSPYRTLQDLIAAARERPESISFASASSSQQVAAEMLAAMAGVKMLNVPYRSSPNAVQDLIAGRVNLFVADQAVILPGVQGGQLRVLGITTRTRSAQLPDVAPVAEQGLPDYELFAWFALMVPAATPAPIIQRLNVAVRHAMSDSTLQERLSSGFGMALLPSTPAEAAAFIRAETAKWSNAIRAAGIEPQ
ncbi:Bug family tripartite tricarboxylate transporter substrate binding protein [Roseococcus suduntuyensis]|uniref:Tripartite-type tricarboxylate transporter receptor subunit TctC n=1 Tax=Roseococcus suduntuyensis TaxID=455361 RepID=A0A840A949_9PROT|nr:tripartite tricarboxylate transporter substrate-binding protein [Roseococcus suduntuyensis]MBB3896650.1 tripartite-type tricarboxylate transporter receptor subunit TctC [Roseococcus suduntuyensis]